MTKLRTKITWFLLYGSKCTKSIVAALRFAEDVGPHCRPCSAVPRPQLVSKVVHPKCSSTDHTVLPANNTMPAVTSWHSPDVTTTTTEAADIQLQLTTHSSARKDERLSWPSWLTYSGWLTHINGHPSATGATGRRWEIRTS